MKQLTFLRIRAAYAIAFAAILFCATGSFAQSPLRPDLGSASTYAVFTGGGAINVATGDTAVLTGNVGQDGAYAFNGFPPSTYTGTLNRNNAAAAQALADLETAQTADGSVACGTVLGTTIVNGQSFTPGVYCAGAATTTNAASTITFNAQGNGSAIFIVKIDGAFTVAAGTQIVLSNNARAANIYWFVNGEVTVADNSTFTGTIIADGEISFAGKSSLNGRALASPAGAINLASDHMSIPTDSGNNLTVVKPALRDTILGGTLNDTIRWTGNGIARVKTLQYSLDSGATWTMIATITTDSLDYVWHVPDTTSTKALVRVTDTSNLRGVSGIFTIYINKITVIAPAAGAMITEGTLHDTIKWTGTGLNHIKTFAYSLDSGVTWTTIGKDTTNGFTYLWNVPDTFSTKAIIRITDSNGVTGKSGVFTIKSSNIIVVTPAAASMINEGTQGYQITWTGVGLTPKKTFAYSLDSGLTWTTIGSISANVFTYSWNVPDTVSTKAIIRITDSNGVTGKSGVFTIKSSAITVVHPSLAEIISGGTQNYQITWTGTGLTPKKTFALSLDSGLTWTTIGSISSNAFTYSWNVPDTVSTKAIIRITDSNNVTGKSGIFIIKSSQTPAIIVLRPAAGETILGGTANYQITFTGYGIAAQKTFAYSLDNGATWHTIGTITSNALTYAWPTVPDTASSMAQVRITDGNGVIGKSGIFTIKSSKLPAIVIITPAPGEVILEGTPNYQITWTGTGTGPTDTLFYSLDNGATWTQIAVLTTNVFAYSWNVLDTASTMALIRITDNNGVSGISGPFIVSKKANPASITIINPAAGEVIAGGMEDYQIVFNAVNTTPQKTLEYSLDGGADWNPIGSINSDGSSYYWAIVPNAATTDALVRITDANGVFGTSAPFTITATQNVGSINSITLTGLDGNRNIGNNQNLGIAWAYIPDIGTSVEVDYSLDNMLTWNYIATVPTTESPNSITWMTTDTGYHNPVFIRVTSTEGMTATSVAFSIGSVASVSSDASQSGYSVSNYPNPVSEQTAISFDLPVRSDVTLIVSDNLGRQISETSQSFESGIHTIPFDASQLADGVYNYTLVAGTMRMNGRMNVVR